MKILLVKSERLTESERWVTQPLGILYLASVARRLGHEAEILDLRIHSEREALARLDRLLAAGPRLVGLSALSHQAGVTRFIADHVRKHRPEAAIVAGGPLPFANTEYVLNELPVDACVIGEGESAFEKIIQALDAGVSLVGIPGVVTRDNVGSPQPAAIGNDLDLLPRPAWDLVDFDSYARFLSVSLRMGRCASMLTSRGCPYRCIFCQHVHGFRFRARSPEDVLEEAAYLHGERGIPRIEVVDECFNLDTKRAVKILEGFRDRFPKLKLAFASLRGDLIDEPFVRLLKEARCVYLTIAIESANDRVQKMIDKHMNMEKVLAAAALLARYRIPALVYFMVGFPSEMNEEMEETFAMAEKLKGLAPAFSLATPYPRTPLWDLVYPEGRSIDPESIDAMFGYRRDASVRALEQRAARLSTRAFLHPRYWFVLVSEIRWRLFGRRGALSWKLIRRLLPRKWVEHGEKRSSRDDSRIES